MQGGVDVVRWMSPKGVPGWLDACGTQAGTAAECCGNHTLSAASSLAAARHNNLLVQSCCWPLRPVLLLLLLLLGAASCRLCSTELQPTDFNLH